MVVVASRGDAFYDLQNTWCLQLQDCVLVGRCATLAGHWSQGG
jgi:hypothetical protein